MMPKRMLVESFARMLKGNCRTKLRCVKNQIISKPGSLIAMNYLHCYGICILVVSMNTISLKCYYKS
jgi:hypothetical protein